MFFYQKAGFNSPARAGTKVATFMEVPPSTPSSLNLRISMFVSV
jgi:hypothetical protein